MNLVCDKCAQEGQDLEPVEKSRCERTPHVLEDANRRRS